jgi:enterochelin esterase family protein
LLETIMPLVESRFAVKTGKAHTAMVGLSMGGGQTLRVGLANPEKFAWIGAFSSAIFARDGVPPKPEDFMKSVATANEDFRLIWIGCGRQDGLFAANEALAAAMKARGIRHVWHPTEGPHMWPLWRDYLREIVPLLFRQG